MGLPETFGYISELHPDDPSTWESKLFLTFDIDWAHDDVLPDSVDLVERADIAATWFAGAFCDFEGQNVIIWNAELVDEFENFCAVPGQVTRIGEGFIEAVCGEGKLRILSVEMGTDIAPPSQFIKSIRKRLT